MFFYPKIFFYAILFAAGLEIIVSNQDIVFPVLFFLCAGSIWQAARTGKKWHFIVLPFLFSLSSCVLLFLIDPLIGKQIFIFICFVFYYFLLLGTRRLQSYEKDQTARGMLAACLTATLFFFYSAGYGVYLNFLIPLWLLMSAFLLATALASFQYFKIISPDKKVAVRIYSIILGLAMSEIAWIINFWPFGYLTTGVVVLIFFYVLWDLAQSHFLNLLSKKRVVANMTFFTLVVAIIFLTSKWLPNV